MGNIVKYIFNLGIIKAILPLYIGMSICIIWVLTSAFILVKFRWFQQYDAIGGYQIKNITEEKDAGLNFFLTLILPLLVNDITTWNGLLTMIFLVSIITCLLSKTNLYYQNPILAILKYKVYRFEFVDNEQLASNEYIALIRGKLSGENIVIEYKEIEDNVLVVRKEV